MNELVSICWTTHHEPVSLIKETLDSLANQTYKNLEVIMVNDCSVIPGVKEYLEYYNINDNRFKLVNLTKNVGYTVAKNIGAMCATGTYFMFIDGDQVLGCNTINESINAFDNNTISVGWKILSADNMEGYFLSHITNTGIKLFNGIGSCLFKHDMFNKIGYLNNDVNIASDCEWFWGLLFYMRDNHMVSKTVDGDNIYMFNHVETNRCSNFVGKKRALFLDRDGVINKLQPNYVKNINEFIFDDGAIEALQLLSDKFDYIFVVTNQQCVSKGIISQSNLDDIHNFMIEELNKNNVSITKIYTCTELEETKSYYRKPNIGMGILAKNDFKDIDFYNSYMVGDMNRDIKFGNALGMKTVLVNQSDEVTEQYNYKFNNLYDFAAYFNNNINNIKINEFNTREN